MSEKISLSGKKILVYHAGALGDFILAVPAILAWKKRYSGFPVFFLGKRENGALGLATGIFNYFQDVESASTSRLFSTDSSQDWLDSSSLHAALLFCVDTSPLLKNLKDQNIPEIVHHAPFPPNRINAALYHLSLIDPQPDSSLLKTAFLPLPTQKKQSPDVITNSGQLPIAAIHPGSGSVKKNWPMQNFQMVAQRLANNGYLILWILGPAESKMPIPLAGNIIRDMPLSDIAYLLGRCSLFLGNDSGISHLAVAVGCRSIVLFGPTDPEIWGPSGPSVTIIKSPNGEIEEIRVDQVFEQILRH